MDFVDWWKKSSKEATETHYAQRFDMNELNDIRRGFLNDSAKRKVLTRINDLKKRNKFLLIGCGIPLILFTLSCISILLFVFFRALWQNVRNPIIWFFVIFSVLVVTAMLLFFVKILLEWQRRRGTTAIDLQDNKVEAKRGKVIIKIERTRNNFSIHYAMNGVEFIVLDDAIGWEIHTHFFGGPMISGPPSRETTEDYIFYFLPNSKTLLHYELA